MLSILAHRSYHLSTFTRERSLGFAAAAAAGQGDNKIKIQPGQCCISITTSIYCVRSDSGPRAGRTTSSSGRRWELFGEQFCVSQNLHTPSRNSFQLDQRPEFAELADRAKPATGVRSLRCSITNDISRSRRIGHGAGRIPSSLTSVADVNAPTN